MDSAFAKKGFASISTCVHPSKTGNKIPRVERQLLHRESSEELGVRISCSRVQIQMVTSSQCSVRSTLLQAVYISMFMSKKSAIKQIRKKYLEKFYTNIVFCKLINNRSYLPTPITPLCVE
jgi:hypothetical protein